MRAVLFLYYEKNVQLISTIIEVSYYVGDYMYKKFFLLFIIVFSLSGCTQPTPIINEQPKDIVDCEVTPLHRDCLRIVDCDITPEDPVCEEFEIDDSECTFSDKETFYNIVDKDETQVIKQCDTLGEAIKVMKALENYDYFVVSNTNTVVAMMQGHINFKTKPITEITLLAQVGISSPTYINGQYNADGAFISSDGIYTIGMIQGVTFEVLTNEIELIPYDSDNNGASYYYISDGELFHRISVDIQTKSYHSIGPIDKAPDYLHPDVKYYSFDNHYFYDDYILMTRDYQNDTREHAVNHSNPYYNYYMYLSLRSKTNYTVEELNRYIDIYVNEGNPLYNQGDDIIRLQEDYFVNGAIELSFAIHESGWGNSRIAQDKNNFFGINAVDSSPYESATSFSSVYECFEYHVSMLNNRYFNPMYQTSFGTNIGNKKQGMNYKYASDAYWGEKIAAHYYRLDKALGFKDYHFYQIAKLNQFAIGYYGPNTNSRVIYNQEDYIHDGLEMYFTVVQETEQFYVLRLPIGIIDYEMNPNAQYKVTDVFYVLKTDVEIVSGGQ